MFASGVVEAVDVLKEGFGNVLACRPSVPPDQFGFEGFEECLDSCIVIAIASATHRYFEAQVTQALLIVMRTVLAASVGVVKTILWWVSKGHGIVQRLQCQIAFQAIASCPSHDTA